MVSVETGRPYHNPVQGQDLKKDGMGKSQKTDEQAKIAGLIAHGIRNYCASVEVKSDGDKTPDPMWYAFDYTTSILTALTAAGYEIRPAIPDTHVVVPGGDLASLNALAFNVVGYEDSDLHDRIDALLAASEAGE